MATAGAVAMSSFVAVENLNTLIDFRYQQHFKAKRGEDGSGRDRTGAGAPNLDIKVPVGTQILAEDKETVIADMVATDQKVVIARGGRGGRGKCALQIIDQSGAASCRRWRPPARSIGSGCASN